MTNRFDDQWTSRSGLRNYCLGYIGVAALLVLGVNLGRDVIVRISGNDGVVGVVSGGVELGVDHLVGAALRSAPVDVVSHRIASACLPGKIDIVGALHACARHLFHSG